MSQTKATLEEVRKAFDALLSMGRTPSLANVLALTKGSRSTVAKHVRTIRAEIANAVPDPAAPLVLLHALSEPLVRQVWAEAQKLASGAYEQHLRSLQTIQAGLSQDLEDLLVSEEAAVERAEAAEARLLDLDRQLQVRVDLEAQLRSLKQIAEQMGASQPASAIAAQPSRPAALTILLETLASKRRPVSKEDVDRTIVAAGYEAAAAHKARWHAVDREFALATERGIRLTKLGREKLSEARRNGQK